MAVFNESLTIEQGNTAIRVSQGFQITRAQRGIGVCVILDLGRLHSETLELPNRMKPLCLCHGQISFMIESDWRVEGARSIHFGSGFSDRRIDSLIGKRIAGVELLGRLPELRLELDDGRAISTFTNWTNQPRWSVGVKDAKLFTPRTLPLDADISSWIYVRQGHLEVDYCYDDANIKARRFFRQLGRA
jgi:hypothetical protein